MAGKTRKEKQKKAKTKKLLNDEFRRKLIRRSVASKQEDEVGNNGEPLPPSAETVNEDEQKDALMVAGAEEAIRLGLKREEETEIEGKPFDPQDIVAKLLRGNGA